MVDLKLALKALPARVNSENCDRVMLFDFKMSEISLISYQNSN